VKRRAFKVLVGLSLALFVATAMLWVRSYSVADKCEWDDENAGHRLFSQEGRLGLIELKHSVINSGLFIGSRFQPGKWDHEFFGFSYFALPRPYYFWSIRID
jgi:hypothetical protein